MPCLLLCQYHDIFLSLLVCGLVLANLAQIRIPMEEGISIKDLPLPGLPVHMFLIDESCGRGQPAVGVATPGQAVLGCMTELAYTQGSTKEAEDPSWARSQFLLPGSCLELLPWLPAVTGKLKLTLSSPRCFWLVCSSQ